MQRRDFLKRSAWAGLGAMAASQTTGCASLFGGASGAPMMGWADKPLSRVKIGIIGIGSRGSGAVERLAMVPGAEIVAVCDKIPERAEKAKAMLVKAGKPAPTVFTGSGDSWKALADYGEVNLVYIVTPWLLHTPMAVYAMRAGKHAVTEVPSAVTMDECWELVETSEKTRRHFMMLENCCYGENEMLMLNLCRKGMMGELIYGVGGYQHDLRGYQFKDNGYESMWRLKFNAAHNGNPYPTHGLGPICQYMNINRGDVFDYLTSVSSGEFGLTAYATEKFGKDSAKAKMLIKLGDMNSTLVRTKRGRLIIIAHDVSTGHPYSRINMLQGTKGKIEDYPFRAALEPDMENWMKPDQLAKFREEYKHPLWKRSGELAKKQGGHGGMDFLMDLRLVYCLRNGLPLDMNAYDAAEWCSIVELSERSADRRGASVDVPDFTRGGWRTAKPLGIVDVEI